MDWNIRPARLNDVEALADVHVAAWNAARPAGFESLPVSDRIDQWRNRLESEGKRHSTFVAEIGGSLAGFVRVRPTPDDDMDSAVVGRLDELYVAEAHWGSGLAHTLMDRGLTFLTESGFSRAVLWVIEEHPRAHAFYAKHSWSPDGARKIAFSAHGREVMEIRFTKTL
ncbi:MAG: GNAT family N-acetyltransferase [Actinomycetota bacterium]